MESSLQPKALKNAALSRPIVTAAPRIAAKPNGRTDPRIRQVLPWLVPLLILIVWQSAASFGWITSRIMPSPLAVIKAAVDLATDGQLFSSIAISTGRALSGLIVGGGIGFVLGLSTGLSKWSEVLLDTTVQMIRTIPNLGLIPLVILWFGIGDSARLFLIALGVFFPIYINTFHGIRGVDGGLIEMGQVYGLSGWQLFRQVIFPGALPSILVGLRLSLGIMWLTLIVAETIAVDSGIGFIANEAREFVRTDRLLFIVILYALLGKLSDMITRLLERRLLRWQPQYHTQGQSNDGR
jgi:sulfonate transport system permease protein